MAWRLGLRDVQVYDGLEKRRSFAVCLDDFSDQLKALGGSGL